MKSILFLFLIISIGLYVFWNDLSIKYIKYGGINPYSHAVSLRKTPNLSSTVISKLKPKNFSELKESESKWIHYYTLKNNLYVRKKDFTLGYAKILDSYIIKEKILSSYRKDIYYLLPFIIFILGIWFFILIAFWIFRRKPKSKKIEAENTVIEEKIIIKEIPIYDEKLTQDHQRLKHSYMTLQNELKESKKINIENNKTLAVTTKKLLEAKKIKNLKEIEEKFYKKAKKEIEAVYKNDIHEMEIHVSNLVKKYNEAKENALILGVDIEDSKIANLVKGRLFEIFSARIWNDSYRTVIKDWTPDKGFKEGIYIESNGNPDFVIHIKEKNINISVECKYRSKFTVTNFNKQKIFTNLDKNKKIERYKNYQQKSGIKVYILLGIEGVPENPKYLYLVPLDELDNTKINYSEFDNFMTTKNRLEPYRIYANTLIDKLI
jgi:hypothetical protein